MRLDADGKFMIRASVEFRLILADDAQISKIIFGVSEREEKLENHANHSQIEESWDYKDV